jgi:SOS response regulatory protein OraA/RecX
MSPGTEADGAPIISRVEFDRRDATLVHVVVGSRRVGDAPACEAEALGVRPGAEWTPALAALCREAMEARRCMKRALAILCPRAISEAALTERLAGAGFGAGVIERTVARLRDTRVLDDRSLAAGGADSLAARGAADALIRQRLERAGLAAADIDPAIAGSGVPEAARVLEVARSLAEGLPADLPPGARWRRVLAGLSRRGYAEDQALDAARAVLGEPEGA